MCEGNRSNGVARQCLAWYLACSCATVTSWNVIARMGMMDADRQCNAVTQRLMNGCVVHLSGMLLALRQHAHMHHAYIVLQYILLALACGC